jgi:hypothetical protein
MLSNPNFSQRKKYFLLTRNLKLEISLSLKADIKNKLSPKMTNLWIT